MKRHVIGTMNSCKQVERKIIMYCLSIASITGLVFVMNMHLQVKLLACISPSMNLIKLLCKVMACQKKSDTQKNLIIQWAILEEILQCGLLWQTCFETNPCTSHIYMHTARLAIAFQREWNLMPVYLSTFPAKMHHFLCFWL